MTDDEHDMIKKVHDFLFTPPLENKPSRAQQIDDLLSAVRAGKLGARSLLWIAGFAAAMGAFFAQMKGWWK